MQGGARSNRPDTAVLAWMRLGRVFQKIQQSKAEEMRGYGLSIGQFDVLVNVGLSEGATQQEVADALLVTKSNICQLLDRMERAGLVRRRQEGRANRLHLTDEGRRLYARALPSHQRQIAQRLSTLTANEQRNLLALLRKLEHGLG